MSMQFYQTEPVSDRITLLRSACGELLYLIEGTDRAVLVDTSVGVGHLRALVDSLTDRPVSVLLTHGHVDHAPGAPAFDDVYLNPLDVPLYRRFSALEERKGYLRASLGPRFAELTEEDYVPPEPDKALHPLTDGQTFDLGGLHAAAYELHGHTPGCMVVLIPEERILILGDACNNSTFLFDGDACSVEEYRDNLRAARDRLAGSFDRVFLAHHEMETGADIMDNVLALCEELLTCGGADDVPFAFLGMYACIAKKCSPQFHREDGVCGNLIYSKEKLYRKR